jgi:hypothetical protein
VRRAGVTLCRETLRSSADLAIASTAVVALPSLHLLKVVLIPKTAFDRVSFLKYLIAMNINSILNVNNIVSSNVVSGSSTANDNKIMNVANITLQTSTS